MAPRATGVVAMLLLAAIASSGLVAPAASQPTTGAATTHVIRNGDTLSGIAKQYGVTVASLVRANALKENARLKIGTRLSIPPPADRPAVGAGRTPSAPRDRTTATTRRPTTMRRPGRMPANLILAIPEFVEPVPLFAWPVDGGVSSNFGRRRMGWHKGIDIIAPPGAPVLASAPGMVVASGVEGRYGRVVKVAHENGFVSVYAHNTENLVDLGQWVALGQVIATVGRTGRATAEHLHFEIRREGFAYNPLYLLPLPSRMAQAEEMDPDEDDEHD